MTESISTTTMKSYRKTLLSTFFFLSVFILTAQEVCDNGVDDDGDGLVDCFDPDCAASAECDDFFFGNSVVCFEEVDVTSFAIRQQWGSADQTATSHASPVVGDLDQNGIPEVISVNNYGNTVTVLNGSDGSTMFQTGVGFNPENTPAIANVFFDETTEILVTQNEGSRIKLFSNDLSTTIWSYQSARNDMGIAGFADFNEDGIPEVYYKNEILNAQTGALIIQGDGDWERDYIHGPVAIDILDATDADCIAAGADCSGLELVTGNHIWAIDIGAGTRTIVKDMNDVLAAQGETDEYFPKYWGSWLDGTRSAASVADYNLDGNMDILLSGAFGSDGEDFTTIFFWDVINETVVYYQDPSNNFIRGPGRINIGDVDGDGQLNANFVMDQKLYSLDENFGVHWIKAIKEGSSGFTGCTLFDFDGDGTVETVYRSEESVLIIDGLDGSTRNEIPCVSRTQEEYPVVADVDGDGASEICLACYTNDATSFSPYKNTQFSHIRVYESDGEAWMPARDVWNQHGYFNVNINDDLTVPTELQDHTLVFSDGLCEYSDGTTIPFPSRPLNTFLTQAPILDENGCVEFVSPDLVILGNAIAATDAVCPDAEITVTFTMSNEGDTEISGGLPVSYYAGDPTVAGSQYLDTEIAVLLNFDVGETMDIVQTISGIGGEFDLFIVVNDLGGTPPIASTYDGLPNATIPECETGNNYTSVSIGFEPFSLTVEKLEDDRRCDLTKTPNGSARAYYFGTLPAEAESIYLENFDDRTIGDQSDSDETAWSTTPGTGGPTFYGVSDFVNSPSGGKLFRATNTGTNFGSGDVTWVSENIDISDYSDISVTMDVFEEGNMEGLSNQWYDEIIITYELYDVDENLTDSGEFPTNGNTNNDFNYLQASLTDVNPLGGGSPDSLLVITVEIHNTSDSEHHYIDNINVYGTKTANLTEQEQDEAAGLQFAWYNAGDYSTVLSNSSIFSQMPAGNYEVIGYFPDTECGSDTVSVEILNLNATSTPPYEVYSWIYEVSPLDDCGTPNGSLSAFVYTTTQNGTFPASVANPPQDTLRTADGYLFDWRITNDATNTIIGTGDLLSNLTNQSYTVDVTEDFSGCVSSAALTVSSALTFPPDPTVNVVNINTCGGSGTLSADVNGNTTDYTFEWFDGDGVKPVADHTGVNYVVTEAGNYTVRATEISSSCASNPVTAPMVDDSNAPTGSVSLDADNTSCGTPNGAVSADGDGAGTTTGYTFTWYNGANTLAANELPGASDPNAFLIGGNPYQLGGLDEGTYRVVVLDDATMCTDTLDIGVTDVPTAVTFTAGDLVVNHINSCNPGTLGSIDASGTVPAPTGDPHTYELYIGATASAPADFTNTTGVFNDLDNGEYVIIVYDGDTECEAGQVDAEVQRFTTQPDIVTNLTHDSSCSTDAGEVEVTSSMSTSEPVNYTYEIYDGHSFTTQIGSDVIVADGTTGHTFTGLDPGDYRVNVINNDTECSDFTDVVINDVTVIPAFLTNITNDNTSCGTANGLVGVTVDADLDLLQENASDFRFTWYDGDDTGDPVIVNNEIGVDILSTGSGYNIDAGFYTVVAEVIATGCTTAPLTLEVYDDPYIPNIVITEVSPQTDCGTGNGSLTAHVTNDPDGLCTVCTEADGFSFQWQLNGVDLTNGAGGALAGDALNNSAPSGVATSTVSGLVADEYTVVVTYDALSCNGSSNLVLSESQTIPVVTLNSSSPNTSCNPASYDGSITVDVTPAGTYDFDWFYSSGTQVTDSGPTTGSNSATLSGIVEDTYKVVATSTLDCTSDTLSVTIALTPAVIAANGTIDSHQTVCVPSVVDPNGQITVDPTTASGEPTGGYDIQWYFGSGTGNTLDATDLVDGDALAGTSATGTSVAQTVSGLEAGTYTVEITNDDTQCSITEEFTIDDNSSTPTFAAPTTDVVAVDMTDCVGGDNYPNGGISIDLSAITGTSPYTVTYYFGASVDASNLIDPVDGTSDIFTEKGTAGTANLNITETTNGTTAASITGLDPGDYTIEVTDATGCTTAAVTVNVGTSPAVIAANGTIDSHQTVCVPSVVDPNGQITVDPTTASGEPTGGYDIQWYFGSGTGNTLDATDLVDGDALAGTSATGTSVAQTVSGLEAGTYTVEITNDDTQCSITEEFTIDDNSSTPTFAAPTTDVVAVDMTDCVGGDNYPNGGISIDLSAITGTSPYTVTYYFGASVDASNLIDPVDGTSDIFTEKGTAGTANLNITETTNGTTAASITGLDPGDYTIEVTDATGCTTAAVTVNVGTSPAVIAANGTIDSHQTVCVPSVVDPNGQITVDPTTASGEPTGGYDIQWYFGSGTGNTLDATDLVDGDALAGTSATGTSVAQTVSGLEAGTYTVEITNDDTQCSITEEFTIDDNSSTPTFAAPTTDVVAVDMTDCVGGDNYPNGGISIDLSAITGTSLTP